MVFTAPRMREAVSPRPGWSSIRQAASSRAVGFAPGVNIGKSLAIFEAVHGSAPDIAGKGIANPSALLLAACLMLDHMGQHETAAGIRDALKSVVREGKVVTSDLGGTASTTAFADAIIEQVNADA